MMFEQCSIEVNFMDKAENIKERIIEVTTKLIERCDGNAKSITARMIAEKAGIGLGLINYHFGSKENLITECVQRIIGKVVTEFRMTECFETDKERLTACAIRVFDFLFEHSAISRISILDDLQNFTATCNSAYAGIRISNETRYSGRGQTCFDIHSHRRHAVGIFRKRSNETVAGI